MEYVIIIILSYLFGTISPSMIVAKRLKNIDIRDVNSKNAGTSNVAITVGLKWGILVGFLDIFKGFLPVLILRIVFPENDIYWVIGGFFTIIGHIYPFHMKFKGGKGTAAFGGLVLAIMPVPSLILAAIFTVSLFVTDFIALATLVVIILVPLTMIYLDFSVLSIVLVTIYSLLSFYLHFPNFVRIYKKQEVGLKASFSKK
jgi:glycerol-3-phosphate acyltransferase PlsY